MELKNALMRNEEVLAANPNPNPNLNPTPTPTPTPNSKPDPNQVLAAMLDNAEHGDGHVYKKDFIRIIRTIKPLGGKAEASNPPPMNQPPMTQPPMHYAPMPQCHNAPMP